MLEIFNNFSLGKKKRQLNPFPASIRRSGRLFSCLLKRRVTGSRMVWGRGRALFVTPAQGFPRGRHRVQTDSCFAAGETQGSGHRVCRSRQPAPEVDLDLYRPVRWPRMRPVPQAGISEPSGSGKSITVNFTCFFWLYVMRLENSKSGMCLSFCFCRAVPF